MHHAAHPARAECDTVATVHAESINCIACCGDVVLTASSDHTAKALDPATWHTISTYKVAALQRRNHIISHTPQVGHIATHVCGHDDVVYVAEQWQGVQVRTWICSARKTPRRRSTSISGSRWGGWCRMAISWWDLPFFPPRRPLVRAVMAGSNRWMCMQIEHGGAAVADACRRPIQATLCRLAAPRRLLFSLLAWLLCC